MTVTIIAAALFDELRAVVDAHKERGFSCSMTTHDGIVTKGPGLRSSTAISIVRNVPSALTVMNAINLPRLHVQFFPEGIRFVYKAKDTNSGWKGMSVPYADPALVDTFWEMVRTTLDEE